MPRGKWTAESHPKGGRPKGSRNKLAVEAETMIDEAWKKLGGSEFLVKCARDPKNIPAVLSLFGRRVRQKVELSGGLTWTQIVDQVNRAQEAKRADVARAMEGTPT